MSDGAAVDIDQLFDDLHVAATEYVKAYEGADDGNVLGAAVEKLFDAVSAMAEVAAAEDAREEGKTK